jgi:CheY-like chemotaxis protein
LPTILLVNDDLNVRDIISATLAELGYAVLTASDGYEALRVLVNHVVDLLITDVEMPAIGGFELARHAKLMRPNLHVIYLSGRASTPDRQRPSNGLVERKPVRSGELLDLIERVIGQCAVSGPTPSR